LVEDETGGEPTGTNRFVRSSLRSLAERLGQGSPTTVGRLLRDLGFSPRLNVKRFTGPPHPNRDKQFRYLRGQRQKFQKAGCPTLSVDAKKKELVGNFRNVGRKWSRRAEEVNAHDFPQDAQCRAAPYGIYDTTRNVGHICVGVSAETSTFAVDALRQWWRARGKREYPGARRLRSRLPALGSSTSSCSTLCGVLEILWILRKMLISLCEHRRIGVSHEDRHRKRVHAPLKRPRRPRVVKDVKAVTRRRNVRKAKPNLRDFTV
jgi:hypothetical protein